MTYSFLWEHQRKCLEIAETKSRFGFFLDLGLGKSLTALSIVHKTRKKSLIVTKSTLIRSVWTKEVSRFYPELTYVVLCGTKLECRVKKLLLNADIYFINHEQFTRSWMDICTGIEMLIVDESGVLRNPFSKLTQSYVKADHQFHFPNLYLFSGLPAPNRSQEYFSQMRLLDNTLFGNNYQAFLAEYFKTQKLENGKRIKVPKDSEDFNKKIRSVSIYVGKEDLKDVPEKLFVKEYLDMTNEQKFYYDILINDVKDYVNKHSIDIQQNVFFSKIIKCLEIFAGFYIKNEGGVKKYIKIQTTLYDTVWEKLQQIPDKQVILWTLFDYEQSYMVRYLLNRKKTVGYISGQHSDKDRQTAINAFKEGKIQYFVLKAASCKYGLNLENAHYSIYLSHNYSYDDFAQSQGRTHRGLMQKNPCTYISMIFSDTISEEIYEALQGKQEVATRVLNYLKIFNNMASEKKEGIGNGR